MSILLEPVRQIGMMVNGYARGAASGGRLFAVLDMEPDIQDGPNSKDLEITKHVRKLFNQVDSDLSGEISYQEFEVSLHALQPELEKCSSEHVSIA